MKTPLNLVWIVGRFCVASLRLGGIGCFFRLFKKKVVSLWVIKSDTNY